MERLGTGPSDGAAAVRADAGAEPAAEAVAARRRAGAPGWARAGRWALLATPAVVVAGVALRSGGFFPDGTAAAALVVWGAVLVRVLVSPHPTAGLSALGTVCAAALALLAAWTLASAAWSDSAARALIEYDRALLYLGAVLLMALTPLDTRDFRRLLRLLALALTGVAIAALASRLLPELVGVTPVGERLNWPLGYWNGLGLLSALALVLCVHLSADLAEPTGVRIAAAAACPLVAATLLYTLSRGAMAAGGIGLTALLVLGRPRGALTALAAIAPPTALAMLAVYDDQLLLDSFDPDKRGVVDAGGDMALRLAVLSAAAAAARGVALLGDARLRRLEIPGPDRRTRRLAAAGAIGILLVAAVAADAPGRLEEQWTRFGSSAVVPQGRDRLGTVEANARVDSWDVGLDAFAEEPLTGTGAATYGLTWVRERPVAATQHEAHSLYVEILSELGVVGGVLLACVLATGFAAIVLRRRAARVPWSAALAVALAWAVHAGVDWDWEMPAVTLPVMVLFGSACARAHAREPGRLARAWPARVGVAVVIAALAIVPVRLFASQTQLTDALAAFRAGDCPRTSSKALGSLDALDSRPEPFELLGYCDVRVGREDLAVRMLEAAVERDPHNWEVLHGLALVRAAAGSDPRPVLRRALAANPKEPILLAAAERFGTGRAAEWRRRARDAPIVITLTEDDSADAP